MRTPFSGGSRRRLGLAVAASLLASLMPGLAGTALAATPTVSGGTTYISADLYSTPSYQAVSRVSITEGAAGQLTAGAVITFDAPSGFQFQYPATPTFTDGGHGLTYVLNSSSTSQFAIRIVTASTGSPSYINVDGIAAQPTMGDFGSSNSGDITAGSTGLSGGDLSNAPAGTLTEIAGNAAHITLTWAIPSTVLGGSSFGASNQPSVYIEDQYTNTKAYQVALSLSGGTAGAHVTCTNNTITTGTDGNGAWANCSVDKVGTGYSLIATSGTVHDNSSTFNVVAGPAAKLLFTSVPSGTVTTALGIIAVQAYDLGGNPVAVSANVTLSISTNSGSFSCSATLANRSLDAGGAFSWGACLQTIAGSYTVTAAQASSSPSPAMTSATSTFQVTSGPANKLAVCWGAVGATASTCSTTAPTNTTGGTTFIPQPTIVVQDVNGNTVTSDNTTTVALSIASGTPLGTMAGTLTCTGGLTLRVTAGVASFSGCSIDKAATGYRLTATSYPVYTSATSNAFNVAVGTPTKLVWTAQPNSGVAAQPFATQPVVSITDAGGNVVTTAGATITLSILNNPAGGTLTCTGGLSKATYLGAATFSGCAINNAGVGYTLAATAANVSPVVSLASIATNPFTVVAPQATITLSTSATAIIWAKPVTLTVQFGLNGANKPFVLQRSINNLDWAAVPDINVPTSTNASGTATFTSTPDRNYYYRVMFAGTADLSAAYSNTVRVVVRQIALLRPIRSGSFYVRTGSSMTFTTTVRPARADLPVKAKVTFTFKLYRAGHLVYSGRRDVYIDAYGKASWTWRFGSPGTWQVRAVANPTPVNANSYWSQIDTVIAY